MSTIQVRYSTVVRPATETPQHSLWLSKLDMLGPPYSHNNVLHVYPNCEKSSVPNFFDTNILKEALSRVLVPFYPVAGRLKQNNENGRFEIDSNGKGVIFVEAEANMSLDLDNDLADKYIKSDSEEAKLLFPKCDYTQGLSSIPILLVQITRFKCGGVCLGTTNHHYALDGASLFHFVEEWGRFARGLELSIHPVHDRASFLAPRNPPQVKFRHLEPSFESLIANNSPGEMMTEIESIFKLKRDEIDALKQEVISSTKDGMLTYMPSTFSIIAGHVWQSACKARGLVDDQDVKLTIPTNGRFRFKDPPLPLGYCGNVMFFAMCVEKAGNVIKKPLWYVASKIHEAVKKFEDIEFLRSAIDFVESHPNLEGLISDLRGPPSYACPNLSINSLARIQSHKADFGWGGPKFMSPTQIKYEGKAFITSSSNGDGSVSLVIKLYKQHMGLFKNYFYDVHPKSTSSNQKCMAKL